MWSNVLLPIIQLGFALSSINVLSKSKSRSYVTWIVNLTKLFFHQCTGHRHSSISAPDPLRDSFHSSSTNSTSYESWNVQLKFEASGGFGSDRGQNEKNLRRNSNTVSFWPRKMLYTSFRAFIAFPILFSIKRWLFIQTVENWRLTERDENFLLSKQLKHIFNEKMTFYSNCWKLKAYRQTQEFFVVQATWHISKRNN